MMYPRALMQGTPLQPLTVRMMWTARFSVHILLLHQYRRNLAHLSDFDSLVNGILKYET